MIDKQLETDLYPLPKKESNVTITTAKQKKIDTTRSFFIEKINLIGCESFPAEDFSFILKQYENTNLDLAKIDLLTKNIEEEYLKKGIIAACLIPPQKIDNNILTVRIIEAKMGSLEIKAHRYFNNQRLAHYWKIPSGTVLNYDQISRSLYLMNKNPDREVRSTLSAGQKPLTTDVNFSAKTHLPIHMTTTIDREGSTPTGIQRNGFGLRHNNLLGKDDMFFAGYNFGKNFSGIYLYHIIPIGFSGTSILFGFNKSRSKPKKEFSSYSIKSEAENYSFLIYYDLKNNTQLTGEIHAGLKAKDKTTIMSSAVATRNRLRIIQAGATLYPSLSSGNLSFNIDTFQGINHLGARRKNELSSRDSKNTFFYTVQELNYKKRLFQKNALKINIKTQIAGTRLPSCEQFSLGGIDSVRGYPAGDYSADNAIETKLEILYPAIFIPKSFTIPFTTKSLRKATSIVQFYDHGYARKHSKLSIEKKSANLSSLGIGLRIKPRDKALLRLEWGFPIGDKTITEQAHSRFHISFDLEF